ncbi:MAG TPA: FHA domain-containing protein [Coriobacteriia bacterium]|nr:FHA domain-containing protein [Coriobacteriia bacterium]
MGESKACPVCGEALAEGVIRCDSCGFSLSGTTEQIDMIDKNESGLIGVCGDRGKARLTLTKGPLKGEVFYLEDFPLSIGREPSCDIFLNNMTVSREHAVIENIDGQITVTDRDSLNGTWVDGKCVDHAVLYEDSLLQIGTFSMRFSCS